MSETKQTKRDRKRALIALGIICIILAVALVGAFAYSESLVNTKSSQDQVLRWTEGYLSFNLNASDDTNYTISTAGFRSLTIMIRAKSLGGQGFQVFVGSIVNDTITDYQVYGVPSLMIHPPSILEGMPPWAWLWEEYGEPFEQTFEIHSSQVMVWLWNNSTGNIFGNVYYYLTA